MEINEEKLMFIRSNVNSDFFDYEKIAKYLQEHDIIGEEIFSYSCKIKWEKISGLSEKNGYKKVSSETFYRRIPFYYYVNSKTGKNFIIKYLSSFPSKMDDQKIERLYECFENLLIKYGVSLDVIDEYPESINYDSNLNEVLFDWEHYLYLNEKLNCRFEKAPTRFPYYYNTCLEKAGEKPKIYFIERNRELGTYFKRKENIIEFTGQFPVDEKGNPILKWIGIKIFDLLESNARLDSRQYGTLTLILGYKGIVKYFINTINGLSCRLAYSSPWHIDFDYDYLLKKRVNLCYSRNDVTERTGIPQKTLEKWEKGERTPNGLDLIKLMSLYSIYNISELVKETYINMLLDDSIEFGLFK